VSGVFHTSYPLPFRSTDRQKKSQAMTRKQTNAIVAGIIPFFSFPDYSRALMATSTTPAVGPQLLCHRLVQVHKDIIACMNFRDTAGVSSFNFVSPEIDSGLQSPRRSKAKNSSSCYLPLSRTWKMKATQNRMTFGSVIIRAQLNAFPALLLTLKKLLTSLSFAQRH
jgi:hypothetical protein